MHIRRLIPVHASAYRAIMLEAYATEPGAFTATVPEREPLPLDWWVSRVSDHPDAVELVYGAFVDERLVGVAGLRFMRRERTRHKAFLFGLFVLPSFRGRGIARALVEAVLGHARSTPGTRVVQLTVRQANASALRLYESYGFRSFGVEPLAIRVEDRFDSVVHMWCEVGTG